MEIVRVHTDVGSYACGSKRDSTMVPYVHELYLMIN